MYTNSGNVYLICVGIAISLEGYVAHLGTQYKKVTTNTHEPCGGLLQTIYNFDLSVIPARKACYLSQDVQWISAHMKHSLTRPLQSSMVSFFI